MKRIESEELREYQELVRKIESYEAYGVSSSDEMKELDSWKRDKERKEELYKIIREVVSNELIQLKPEIKKMTEIPQDKKAVLKAKKAEYKELVNSYRELTTEIRKVVESKKVLREEIKELSKKE